MKTVIIYSTSSCSKSVCIYLSSAEHKEDILKNVSNKTVDGTPWSFIQFGGYQTFFKISSFVY